MIRSNSRHGNWMGWAMVASSAALLLAAPSSLSADAAPASQPAAKSPLDRLLPELTFDGVAISDVFDFLRDVTGTNISVNWRRIEDAGVKRDTPVSMRLRNIKFSKALSVVLDLASSPKAPLAYSYSDGVIAISTAEDLKKNTVRQTYDVHDLIAGQNPQEKGAALIKMITGSIASSSWGEDGSMPASIKLESGQLVVVQTPETQEAIENLLASVRQLLKGDKPQ